MADVVPFGFSALLNGHSEKAYRLALRLAGNHPDAHDLLQEALSRALEHKDRFDPARPVGPWFDRILKNVFLNDIARFERRHSVPLEGASRLDDGKWDEMMPGSDPTPLEALGRAELRDLARRALRRLPRHYREAVALRDLERLPYRRIGQVLRCKVGTVRSRIHQGRLLMRRSIERWEDGTAH